MPLADDGLVAKWRRFRANVTALNTAVGQPVLATVQDTAAATLESLYGLWDTNWRRAGQKAIASQDKVVGGGPDGETCAALAWAREENLHASVEFGKIEDLYTDTYRDIHCAWVWQARAGPDVGIFAQRAAWYAQRCVMHDVHATFLAALRWFELQPELKEPETPSTSEDLPKTPSGNMSICQF